MLFRKRYKASLQLFLAASLFLYLYSPFLDHWLGNTHHGRPHTHITLPDQLSVETPDHDEAATAGPHDGHENHAEGILCLLDIDALSIVLDFNVQPDFLVGFFPDASLTFNFQAALLSANPIFVSSLDPPPRI